ncbi:DUF6271 family protein [Streptomyces sp. NBC_01525]|uniref:Uncharacterized protein n=1 Tax=Streptomyces benahoarensis TaxID=2595054 RepID=A0A553YBM6_9ACTN|nr:DUF6271 family protein [Streptomyces benahoarensis]TSB15977.1 hypothetical protein FNJ62_28460 [Streptomyces benahoarensis]TSB26617.1 hypothetical protein FNZ23_26755 [Streptomyces benahoarensis]
MDRICLTLPTNRECTATLTALGEEAAYAADHFGVEVDLLILDSAAAPDRARHARAAHAAAGEHVTVHHLDEAAQRDFLRRVIDRAGLPKPELMLDLMLPERLSYGACTNRAFLLAAALGCRSVHRRDSDSRYRTHHGEPVYPIHHELLSLGKRARDAADAVTENSLDAHHADKPVVMAGASFVGELSVDIGEIRAAAPDIYRDIVGLWAPENWSAEEKRELADISFLGAGTDPFTGDHSTLTLVDPMHVDMCNIGFHRIQEDVPLPPATDTIGSDYFLFHLARSATLPGVLHNRHIVNYYTGERRTDAGFLAYQTRFVKFLLSMLHLHHLYDRMAHAGPALLDGDDRVRAADIALFARESAHLDPAENLRRLTVLDRSYRRLGGRYAAFADRLATQRARLLDEARRDIEDFALLTEAWQRLITASAATAVHPAARRPDRGRR